jgi:sugar phosphate isomerase/epimerase
MRQFINEIREHSLEYGSIPFWSWNDRLQPDELRRQINVMHRLGMNGFFMHARGGLETEYLSEEWYDCIRACVDEAEKLGMEA